MSLTSLLGKDPFELEQIVKSLGLQGFVAKQIADWIYHKNIDSIDQMSNVSKMGREMIASQYQLGKSLPVTEMKSTDGTIKYLFKTDTDHFIEAVYIPDKDRATLCVSSQVGCKMDCHFCMTGKQGFSAQLSASEILNQIYSIPQFEELTNIVFMGMGEPFDNTDELLRAVEVLTSEWGLGWSPKRITVSTIGVSKGMKQFLDNTKCHLAISLHNPFSEERLQIMPIEKAFPIKQMIPMLKQYDFSHQRRLSFEYIMFKGFNDSERHADELAKLISGLPCRVNLIRFHEIPGVSLQTANEESMILFRDRLNRKGVIATIRTSRGEDILAACGMLSTKNKMEKKGTSPKQ